MNEPRCIRIFNDRKAVGNAVILLRKAGFEAYYKQDRFGRFTLGMLGMRPRFRLYVERSKIDEIGEYQMIMEFLDGLINCHVEFLRRYRQSK